MQLLDPLHFIQGYINQAIPQPLHIQEQVALRSFLCSDCVELTKCKHCGCATPAMFYAPFKEDPEQKWGTFLSNSQWLALKNNISKYHEFIEALNNSNAASAPIAGYDKDTSNSDL